MRIRSSSLSQSFLGAPAPLVINEAVSSKSASASPDSEFNLQISAPELVQWSSLLSQQPEVRPEVVEQATQNVQRGVYFTAESANKTATAILEEMRSFPLAS